MLKKLFPTQVLTLTDYPVHSEHVLKLYHRMFWKGGPKLVPPFPALKISAQKLHLPGNSLKIKKYNAAVDKFFKNHLQTKYVLVDGSHKTTAATLCHRQLTALVLKTDADIRAARKMVERGALFSLTTGDTNSIVDALQIIRKHFYKHPVFETVAEKTDRMVKNKVVPRYMIAAFKRLKK